ncbi:MAG: hypothetical protein LBT15_04865 [Synergistaceae bacterium]|jgi:hypothetical protein|nr:hypothetical protein [Synergistaceae bacterium]
MMDKWGESGAGEKTSLRATNIGPEELWKLLPEKPKAFDIAGIRDESHLREVIMNRVLETAAHNFTVSVNGGQEIAIEKLPEAQQGEHLNKIILKILDAMDGPGPLLRRAIAETILNYRMLIRLNEMLPTLKPSTARRRRVEEGIAHIEKLIREAILYFEAWSFFSDSSPKEKFNAIRRKLLEEVLENPEDA